MTRMSLSSFSSLTALAVAMSLYAIPRDAEACGTDAYTGQICIMAGSYCPRGTAEAVGTVMPITDNTALYSLIGCTYGGDCRSTFALPDLRGRAPVGWGTGPGLRSHPWGTSFGSEDIIQTISEMPAHTHSAVFTPGGSGEDAQVAVSQDPGTTNSPAGGKYLAAPPGVGVTPVKIYNDGTNLVALEGVSGGGSGGGTVTVQTTGGGQPMYIVPPEIAVRYCIVTEGIYPPRS